jgi:hypothetical protein
MAAEWETQAAEQLNRLTNPHIAKKRATIVALVDARLAGNSEETVFGRPDTCSRNIYHAKWKRDPVFADVLEKTTALARDWHGGRSMRALAQAAERLALASPAAVGRAVEVLSTGKMAFKLPNGDTEEREANMADLLRVVFGILDRAGVETAQKSTTVEAGMTLDEWRQQQAEQRKQAAEAMADFEDEDEDPAES